MLVGVNGLWTLARPRCSRTTSTIGSDSRPCTRSPAEAMRWSTTRADLKHSPTTPQGAHPLERHLKQHPGRGALSVHPFAESAAVLGEADTVVS